MWLSGAVVNDPCAFEATTSPPAVGPAGGSGALSIPAPAGCAWTIDPSAVRGLTIGGTLSGTGPATRTFTMTASALPRFGIIGVGRQALPIEQTVPRMHVEFAGGTSAVLQPFAITGWALDESAAPISSQDPGVDAVHVWAYPLEGAPVFVGAVTTGISRADVANTFGNRYRLSGFQIAVSNLPSGAYRLVFFAHSTRSNAFSNVQSVDAVVQQAPQRIVIDTPSASGTVSTPFRVSGWAVDPAAADRNGSGVTFVHVWAYPDGGDPPVFLGAAEAGLPRPDVAVFLGPSADRTGFDLPAASLTPVSYTLVVFAGSVAGPPYFSQAQRLTIAPSRPMMAVDQPRASTSVNANTQIAGWALDLSSSTGTGVDVVQAWAYPVSGGAAVFVGTATQESRLDVAAFVGTRFLDCGFRIDMRGLPAGSYDLAIFARSTVTATFNNVRIVRITVQ